jgi:hypothetical protein
LVVNRGGYIEVIGQDHSPRQLHLLFGAEVPDGAAKQIHRDGDDVVESDHAVVIQPVVGSYPNLAGQALDCGDGSDGQLRHRGPRSFARQDQCRPGLVETNQADLSHRSVLDFDLGAAPLHEVVQVIGGAVLVKNLGVLLGGLSTHFPLHRRRDERGPTGRLAGRNGAVEKGHHLVGKADRDLSGHVPIMRQRIPNWDALISG